MKILGISCFYHDSSASIIVDNEILASAQEERFTREKHTPVFPKNSVKYCLEEAGLKIDELDAVVFTTNQLLNLRDCYQPSTRWPPKGFFRL